jgi:hypothetical protein
MRSLTAKRSFDSDAVRPPDEGRSWVVRSDTTNTSLSQMPGGGATSLHANKPSRGATMAGQRPHIGSPCWTDGPHQLRGLSDYARRPVRQMLLGHRNIWRVIRTLLPSLLEQRILPRRERRAVQEFETPETLDPTLGAPASQRRLLAERIQAEGRQFFKHAPWVVGGLHSQRQHSARHTDSGARAPRGGALRKAAVRAPVRGSSQACP